MLSNNYEGADTSSLLTLEDQGQTHKTTTSITTPLRDQYYGVNSVRQRAWFDPPDGTRGRTRAAQGFPFFFPRSPSRLFPFRSPEPNDIGPSSASLAVGLEYRKARRILMSCPPRWAGRLSYVLPPGVARAIDASQMRRALEHYHWEPLKLCLQLNINSARDWSTAFPIVPWGQCALVLERASSGGLGAHFVAPVRAG